MPKLPKLPKDICVACRGKGISSRGGECVPCKGTGKKQSKQFEK